jgi:hypothetical protein
MAIRAAVEAQGQGIVRGQVEVVDRPYVVVANKIASCKSGIIALKLVTWVAMIS